MPSQFTAADAARILDAFDAFTEVRAQPNMNDLAVLVSLMVALEANGFTLTHHSEVERLRAINVELARAAGLTGRPDREPGLPRRSRIRPAAGWGQGTPVQVAGHGALLWRVAPPAEQDHRDGLITVTCGAKTMRVTPEVLTYAAPAEYVPNERVHRVGGTGPGDWGSVTAATTIALDEPYDGRGFYVLWDSMPDATGPHARVSLERPMDVALRWRVGEYVTHRSGWPGRIVDHAGATVAVAQYPYTAEPTWHHVSDLTSPTG